MKTKAQLIADALKLIMDTDDSKQIEHVLIYLANDIEAKVRSEIRERLFDLSNKVSNDKII